MFLEIELKLSLPPEHTALFYAHPLIAQASLAPESTHLISRYFDTPQLTLWHHGLCLRIRESEGQTIQTLKSRGQQIGDLHHRHEWDQPVLGTQPDIEAFTDHTVVEKLQQLLGDQPLLELFHTSFQRTQWNLSADRQTQIELVFDQGAVHTALRQSPLHELELELKQGDEQQLYVIAEQLKKQIPLILETRSKAERGYKLYMEKPFSTIKA
jgi:triphosphatase